MSAPVATGAASGGAGRGIPPVALAAALVTPIFWGGTVVANRAAVESIDGLTAGALRSMLAGFLGLGIAPAFRLPFPETARHRCLPVISGWLNFALWPTVLSLGVALANASHAALIMALLPVATGLVAVIANRVKPQPGRWLGAALLLTVPAMLVLYPDTAWAEVTADSWLGVGWLTLFSSLAGYALWFLAMNRGGIARIAVFQFLQPVLSVLAAAAILGERIAWAIAAAGLPILPGAWTARKYAH